ncbi:MAG: helix-turn-helix transcriptional regulator [Methylorubrum rhodinum]|uniref:helix-turn-helix transcriptional regulator n=1 Tax=Methylorubrum rhodinum TaxID=29428 RepID=UPI003BB05DAB
MNARSTHAPLEVVDALWQMGQAIKAARLRRRQSASDLASRVGVSLPTLRKLENGDPTVSLGVFGKAVWVLGLLPAVRDAVSPENDHLAAAIETSRLPRRARRSREVNLDDL